MRAIQQTTLARPVTLSGEGLHSGAPCRATLRPAPANAGVRFRVPDSESGVSGLIEAIVSSIAGARLCTTLAGGPGRSIATVEHLMAALSIAGVDNLVVEVDGAEMPILDGSAAPFIAAIERVGVKRLAAAREAIRIMAPVEVSDGDRLIRAEPYEGRILDVAIAFDDEAIGAQSLSIDLDDRTAMRRLSQARTFCRLADVTAMREAGFSRGGSLDNAIVVDGDRILNPAGLRDPEEFALHKALDLVGDLRLAGAPIIGRIVARRPGHDLNARFLRRLIGDRAAYERVVMTVPAARAIA